MVSRLALLKTAAKLINNPFLKYYDQLKQNLTLKKSELENLQSNRLKKLINYASVNIPFYRKRFANLNLVSINNLPVLSKDELKEAGKYAITLGKKKFIRKTTSGTTGPAFTFVVDQDFFSLEIARNLRIFDLTGMEIGEPWVMLVPLRDRKSFIFSKLINRLVLDAKLLSPARKPLCCPASNEERFQADEAIVHSFCNKIKKHKPKVLYSYPSTLIALATFIRNWGLRNIKAEKIITSGEVLTLPARKYIEEIFEGEVFDLYGTTEFPSIAQECKEHNGLHIFTDSYLVEFLENKEIIITDLDNYTMPFIRYKTGDAGILKNSQCGCGREFPLMEIVQGRVSDLIVAPNGEFFRANFFSLLLDKNREIKKFQIIQQEQGKLIIYIICDKIFSASRKDFIIKRFQEYVGNSLDISIEIVSDIGLPPKQFFQTYPVRTTL